MFNIPVLLSGNYISPYSGLNNSTQGSFVSRLNAFIESIYKYLQAFWYVVIAICAIGFVVSIIRYSVSTINNSPRQREDAKSGMLTSLVLLAVCGAVPLIWKLIVTLINYFSS